MGGLHVSTVHGLLELVKATLAEKSHLSFTAGVLCEHCHAGDSELHEMSRVFRLSSFEAQGRSLAERHHVIDLYEILSKEGGPVPCRFSARTVTAPGHSWVTAWGKTRHRR